MSYALITGASSGLGKEYSIELAKKGYDLIIVSRSIDKLNNLKKELEEKYKNKVIVKTSDLSNIKDIKNLEYFIKNKNIEILINNAGFGNPNKFLKIDRTKHTDMIILHNIATTRLTRVVLENMVENNKGYIINVSSVAGIIPSYGNIIYNSTKEYIISFSRLLKKELKHKNIKIQALAPGLVKTDFHKKNNYTTLKQNVTNFFWLNKKQVVNLSLNHLFSKKRNVLYIPTLRYKILVCLLYPFRRLF